MHRPLRRASRAAPKLLHLSWDSGAVVASVVRVLARDESEAFVLRALLNPMTTKTLCGRRVPLARINGTAPTCLKCIAERDRMARAAREAILALERLSEGLL